MSDSVLGTSLLSLFSSSSSSGSSLIGTLYGSGTSGAAPLDSNPIIALQDAQRTQTQGVANEAKQPQVIRDVAAFRKAVTSSTSVTQLLQNPDFQKVFLTANGLGSDVGYTALAAKALDSNPSGNNSLANQLGSAWQSAVQTYQFATKGLSVIQNPQVLNTIANGYAEVLWRQSLDAGTPGLSNALDFIQRGGTITSVDQILGDPTFRAVVTTTLDIPQQIAFQPIGAQEQAISSRINLNDFKSPTFVTQFAQRYLIMEQEQNSTSSSSSVASLLV
ncbi:MAG TPA: DUF1217 domain-containing protein [Acidisphaera sp.]|nr:DUF1217 domain-containing protein [Acidisphaera sp.]HME20042.1 DUF1217 domain-containing protein [Acetobacteraceae bacterium]